MKNTKLEEAAEHAYPIKDDMYQDLWSENRAFKDGANYQAKQDEELAIEFGEWLRTQRADIFYGSPSTKELFQLFLKSKEK